METIGSDIPFRRLPLVRRFSSRRTTTRRDDQGTPAAVLDDAEALLNEFLSGATSDSGDFAADLTDSLALIDAGLLLDTGDVGQLDFLPTDFLFLDGLGLESLSNQPPRPEETVGGPSNVASSTVGVTVNPTSATSTPLEYGCSPSLSLSTSPQDPLAAASGPGHAKAADWARMKAVIEDLYLAKNLNLQDVMEIMASRHGFRATVKMYKSQFAKWRWRKYRPRKAASPSAARETRSVAGHYKTCLRRQSERTRALHHESEEARLLDEALALLDGFIRGSAEADPEWRRASRFELLGSRVLYEADSPVRRMGVEFANALQAFRGGEKSASAAGRHLRSAFLVVEDMLRGLDLYGGLVLVTLPVWKFLQVRQADLLAIYLSHLAELAAALAPRSPVGGIARLVAELGRRNGNKLRQFVGAALELRADRWAARRAGTTSDRSALFAREESYRAQTQLGLRAGGWDEWALRQIINDYDRLIREAAASAAAANGEAAAADPYTVISLRHDVLALQDSALIYRDDFADCARQLMASLAAAAGYGGRGPWPGCDGDRDNARFHLDVLVMVELYLLRRGDHSGACALLPQVLALAPRFCTPFSSYAGDLAAVAGWLRRCGRHGEAEEVARMRQESLDDVAGAAEGVVER